MTEVHLDSQALTTFQTCERKFEYVHILNRDAFNRMEYVHEGSVIHHCLDLFYSGLRQGKNAIESIQTPLNMLVSGSVPKGVNEVEACETIELFKKELSKDNQLLLIRKLADYSQRYANENFKVIDTEVGFSKTIYESADYLFVYEGRIDLIVEDRTGSLFWVDHKKQRRRDPLNHYSNQFFGYSWAVGTTFGIINYIGFQQSLAAEEAFYRETVNHRPDQIAEWVDGAIKTYFDILCAKANGKFHKVRSTCDGKYGKCEFYEICRQTSQNVIKFQLERETKERKWSPWE